MINTIKGTNFNLPDQTKFYKGKVRDVYTINNETLIIYDEDSDGIKTYSHNLEDSILKEKRGRRNIVIGKLRKDNTIIYDLDEDETSSDEDEDEDEDEESTSDEDEGSTSEEDETSSDEDESKKEGNIVDHTKLQRLKTLLKGGSAMKQSFNKDGIHIKEGGSGISQDRFNSGFRGWGFTFF